MLGSLIAGGLGLIGGLGSSLLGNKSTKDTNKANLDLAKYQAAFARQENEKAYQRGLHMWNLQNAYNAPTQQMARIRAAGLNPNLVYGHGVVGNSSSPAPSYQPASFKAPTMQAYRGWNLGLSDAVTQYMAARTNKAQVDNMEAQNKLIRQQASTEATRQANLAMQTARGEYDLGLAKELRDVSVSRAIAEMRERQSAAAIGSVKTEREKLGLMVDEALKDTRINLTTLQYNQAVEALRGLRQDNDMNKFRYKIERVTGKGNLATELIRRLIFAISPASRDGLDFLFNPK